MITSSELGERIARLRAALPRGASMLVSRPEHVLYLTGLPCAPGRPASLGIGFERAVALWPEAIPAAVPDWFESRAYDPWATGRPRAKALESMLGEAGLRDGVLLVDGDVVPLELAGSGARAGAEILAALVREKSPAEIAIIARNLAANDAAFARIGRELTAGANDFDLLGWAMDEICREAGCAVAFEGNIGLGAAGADPDAQPTGAVGNRGDVGFVDLYPARHGYAGDSSRCFAIGSPPAWAAAAHDRLVRALDAAAEALGPGVAAAEVDRVCRAAAAADGGDPIPHHVGHGLGLFGQEPPYLVPGSADVLRAGDVVAIEPGAYREGRGGLRLEDVFAITPTGARRLSGAPRELAVCG